MEDTGSRQNEIPGESEGVFHDGKFLVSETELSDPNFSCSVVLLLEHNEDGAFGLVINRRSTAKFSDILPEYADSAPGNLPVFIGGPVQREYFCTLHSGLPDGGKSTNAIQIMPGVLFEPDFTIISRYLDEHGKSLHPEYRPDIHFYSGYSGWGPGQLEMELNVYKSWLVLPGNAGLVFSRDPEESWRNALRKKGGIYWVAAETGSKPSLN